MGKNGQGQEKLRYLNGDEFEGPMQYLQTLFHPVGKGKYTVAATGAVYVGKVNGETSTAQLLCWRRVL